MVTISGTTPKKGFVAEPGFVAITPGSGVIMMEPVSVCHHVSTIGQRLCPITSRYHIQASGLIGSPTVPSSRRRRVEHIHLVPVDDRPETIGLGTIRRPLIHETGCTALQRPIHDVTVPG